MHRESRREFLKRLAAASAALLEPVRAVAQAAKPVRIRDVELFKLDIRVSKEEQEASARLGWGVNDFRRSTPGVVKIVTDAGVNGYSFAGGYPPSALPRLREILAGQDLFAIEQHLKRGLGEWGGVEHAVWDAVGRIARQPVYRLLGGAADSIKAYLTCVWRQRLDDVAYQEQAEAALAVRKAGFQGMKVQAWRTRPLADVEACREMRAAVGSGFALMFDRTAHLPQAVGQKVWDYETGLAVARGLEKHDAYWLEEPFARDDYQSPARLAAAVGIPITGGEGYGGLEPFRQCVLHRTYDILQPDARNIGGIFMCRKAAILAEASHVPCILHGNMGLAVAGWLQANLAVGCEWQELAHIRPGWLPQQQWTPALKVLKSKEVFVIRDGRILAPQYPGLGLDVDEEALQYYQV